MTVHCLWDKHRSWAHWLGPERQIFPTHNCSQKPDASTTMLPWKWTPRPACFLLPLYSKSSLCLHLLVWAKVTQLNPAARGSGRVSVPLPPLVGKIRIVGNSPKKHFIRSHVATKYNKCPHCTWADLSDQAHSQPCWGWELEKRDWKYTWNRYDKASCFPKHHTHTHPGKWSH